MARKSTKTVATQEEAKVIRKKDLKAEENEKLNSYYGEFYDDEEESNTEVIEIKNEQEKGEVKVIDSETSSILEMLKNQEVANKPKVVTSEDIDNESMVEEAKVDPSVERYLDVDITDGLSKEQVEKRVSEGLTNANIIILTYIIIFRNSIN